MSLTYTQLSESLIKNTVMFEGKDEEGVIQTYRISPEENYVLHDSRGDKIIYDESGNETSEKEERFRKGTALVPATYDFNLSIDYKYVGLTSTMKVNKIGEYQFYAIPLSETDNKTLWECEA